MYLSRITHVKTLEPRHELGSKFYSKLAYFQRNLFKIRVRSGELLIPNLLIMMIDEHCIKNLVERKLQFPCRILFLRLAHKKVLIWGRWFSSIVGFRSPNFAQRNTLVYWNRINKVWEKKYLEMEFRPLGNESSPFCRTEWFHIHVKTAFNWLIGQGGWKLRSRPRFDSW